MPPSHFFFFNLMTAGKQEEEDWKERLTDALDLEN